MNGLQDTLEIAQHGPVIPVVVLQRVEDAVPLARALVAGGVRVIEVTLRSAAALGCIEAIVAQVPDAIVGAGTLRTAADVQAARRAGAAFGVSPGWHAGLAAACRDAGLPLLPGATTATEVMAANADGYRFLKFFPAMAAGGTAMLQALAGPFPDVVFCPTGGITPANAAQFLALPNVRVCGGTWLTPADAVASGDWERVTKLAQATAALRGG